MKKCNVLDIIAFILVVVGGLNWGLIGAFGYNLVDAIFGAMSLIAKIIYILVGLAAIYLVLTCKKCKTCCQKPTTTTSA